MLNPFNSSHCMNCTQKFANFANERRSKRKIKNMYVNQLFFFHFASFSFLFFFSVGKRTCFRRKKKNSISAPLLDTLKLARRDLYNSWSLLEKCRQLALLPLNIENLSLSLSFSLSLSLYTQLHNEYTNKKKKIIEQLSSKPHNNILT